MKHPEMSVLVRVERTRPTATEDVERSAPKVNRTRALVREIAFFMMSIGTAGIGVSAYSFSASSSA